MDIQTDLTARQLQSLSILVECVIPPSADLSLPGAGDALIFGDILKQLQMDAAKQRQLIKALIHLEREGFPTASDEARDAVLHQFRTEYPEDSGLVQNLTVTAYYRDPRVLERIGVEPRPPFPKGYHVEQGDWGLLDPVRQRGKIYRSPTA